MVSICQTGELNGDRVGPTCITHASFKSLMVVVLNQGSPEDGHVLINNFIKKNFFKRFIRLM